FDYTHYFYSTNRVLLFFPLRAESSFWDCSKDPETGSILFFRNCRTGSNHLKGHLWIGGSMHCLFQNQTPPGPSINVNVQSHKGVAVPLLLLHRCNHPWAFDEIRRGKEYQD